MANAEEDKLRGLKNPDMLLKLSSKSESFLSDQTPTPIRLLQKCEEIGIFKDLQSVNPFEETFRKAAEDIRSGSTTLEVSRLSVPSNADDSLHTPHVIFPLANELQKRRAVSPREDISIPDPDPLSISLDSDELDKTVIQQEADTSEKTSICEDESPFGGTIQFLLRMPNGKMVQLSSHPVEQMDSTPPGRSKEKDIPLIKVDSSFLKAVGDGASQNISGLSSGVNILAGSGVGASKSSHDSSSDDNNIHKLHSTSFTKLKSSPDGREAADQLSKMSLAKQKLKQALMNNTCPAANLSSSSGSASISSVSKSSSTKPEFIQERRPSSPSDDGTYQDNSGHDLSSVEEKRRRNRAAAMRCREKRKTWVKDLERRANEMMRTNGQLQHEVSMLRDEVAQLKTLLLAHRDCPVTQALVEGKATLPLGTYVATSVSGTSSQNTKRSTNPTSSSSSFVFQTSNSGNSVKPHILLNDPPAKRKRLNSSTGNTVSSPTSLSAMTSSSSASSVHTLVFTSKSSTVLNPSFVNVIPSVVVANHTTSTDSAINGSQQVMYPQLLTCLPAIAPRPSVGVALPQQAYILPKAMESPKAKVASIILGKNTNTNQVKYGSKLRTTRLLSTNVIKVNPNVVRDTNDSDIEILDVK